MHILDADIQRNPNRLVRKRFEQLQSVSGLMAPDGGKLDEKAAARVSQQLRQVLEKQSAHWRSAASRLLGWMMESRQEHKVFETVVEAGLSPEAADFAVRQYEQWLSFVELKLPRPSQHWLLGWRIRIPMPVKPPPHINYGTDEVYTRIIERAWPQLEALPAGPVRFVYAHPPVPLHDFMPAGLLYSFLQASLVTWDDWKRAPENEAEEGASNEGDFPQNAPALDEQTLDDLGRTRMEATTRTTASRQSQQRSPYAQFFDHLEVLPAGIRIEVEVDSFQALQCGYRPVALAPALRQAEEVLAQTCAEFAAETGVPIQSEGLEPLFDAMHSLHAERDRAELAALLRALRDLIAPGSQTVVRRLGWDFESLEESQHPVVRALPAPPSFMCLGLAEVAGRHYAPVFLKSMREVLGRPELGSEADDEQSNKPPTSHPTSRQMSQAVRPVRARRRRRHRAGQCPWASPAPSCRPKNTLRGVA